MKHIPSISEQYIRIDEHRFVPDGNMTDAFARNKNDNRKKNTSNQTNTDRIEC